MSGFRFRLQLDVRFRDCDMMRHVNNAVYLTYLEEARLAYWREVLRGQASPPRFILARVECDYSVAAVFGDRLDIGLRVVSIGRTSFTTEYEIVHAQRRQLMARARSVQVVFDYATHKKVPMPDDVRERIEAFEGKALGIAKEAP